MTGFHLTANTVHSAPRTPPEDPAPLIPEWGPDLPDPDQPDPDLPMPEDPSPQDPYPESPDETPFDPGPDTPEIPWD